MFPITEGEWRIPKIDKDDRTSWGFDRVRWKDVEEAWKNGVPGTEEDKEEAVENLAQFWKKRCGLYPDENDELLKVAWLTVAREAIIDTLMSKSGLQLKLTANPGNIYCRLRAPMKLLELQADRENYRLQFRGEIDPGSDEFWNREVRSYRQCCGRTHVVKAMPLLVFRLLCMGFPLLPVLACLQVYKKLHGKESMPEAVALEIEEERHIYTKVRRATNTASERGCG